MYFGSVFALLPEKSFFTYSHEAHDIFIHKALVTRLAVTFQAFNPKM